MVSSTLQQRLTAQSSVRERICNGSEEEEIGQPTCLTGRLRERRMARPCGSTAAFPFPVNIERIGGPGVGNRSFDKERFVKQLMAVLILPPGLIKPLAADEPIDCARDVPSPLKLRCATCHTNGACEGDCSMDTREKLLSANVFARRKSAESAPIRRVTSTDHADRMPPIGASPADHGRPGSLSPPEMDLDPKPNHSYLSPKPGTSTLPRRTTCPTSH